MLGLIEIDSKMKKFFIKYFFSVEEAYSEAFGLPENEKTTVHEENKEIPNANNKQSYVDSLKHFEEKFLKIIEKRKNYHKKRLPRKIKTFHNAFYKKNASLFKELSNNPKYKNNLLVEYILKLKTEYITSDELSLLLPQIYSLLQGDQDLNKFSLENLDPTRYFIEGSDIDIKRYISLRDNFFLLKELTLFLKLLTLYLEREHEIKLPYDFCKWGMRPIGVFYNLRDVHRLNMFDLSNKKSSFIDTRFQNEKDLELKLKLKLDLLVMFDVYLSLNLVRTEDKTIKELIDECMDNIGYSKNSDFKYVSALLHFYNYSYIPLITKLEKNDRGLYKEKNLYVEFFLAKKTLGFTTPLGVYGIENNEGILSYKRPTPSNDPYFEYFRPWEWD